jgi:hypothetical protein
MNVALDIDDTITRHPEFFAFLSKALKDAGHKVFVISYRADYEFTKAELAEYGVVYDDLILAGNMDLGLQGFYKWKAGMCRELKIDVFFEDMPEVANIVDESTICFVPFDPCLGRMTYALGDADFADEA